MKPQPLNLGPLVAEQIVPFPVSEAAPAVSTVKRYQAPLEPMVIVQARQKSASVAVVLDIFFAFFGIMGVGSLYAGAPAPGLVLMVGFWFFTCINVALCFVLIGFVTFPITWLVCLLLSVHSSTSAVEAASPDQA